MIHPFKTELYYLLKLRLLVLTGFLAEAINVFSSPIAARSCRFFVSLAFDIRLDANFVDVGAIRGEVARNRDVDCRLHQVGG